MQRPQRPISPTFACRALANWCHNEAETLEGNTPTRLSKYSKDQVFVFNLFSPRRLLMLSIQQLLNPLPNCRPTPELIPHGVDSTRGSPARPARLGQPGQPPSTPRRNASTPPRLPLFSPLAVLTPPTAQDTLLATGQDFILNKKTSLQKLYRYRTGTVLEYPETSRTGAVGHLFEMCPEDWVNPRLSFAYSQGAPEGRKKLGDYTFCKLLVDEDGEQVPCRESHFTCAYHFFYLLSSSVTDTHQAKGVKSAHLQAAAPSLNPIHKPAVTR